MVKENDKTFYEQIVEYCNEHFLVLVEKDVWEDARKILTPQEPATKKIEKIATILKTAKADPTRDEYAEYYLDKIEEVIRWTPT